MAKIKGTTKYGKKEIIAKKAAVLFRKKGFASTSMRELAEALGIEAPSLYNHFSSKEGILELICSQTAENFQKHLEEIETKDFSSVKKLEHLIRFHIRMMINSYDEVYVSNHEWKQLTNPSLSNFLNERKHYESRLIRIIEGGIKAGEFKPLHSYVAVLTILSAVRGLETWHRHKKTISATRLEEDMVTHLLKGLT